MRVKGSFWEKLQQRKSKYNARKVRIDGYTFDSQKEGKEYGFLKIEEKAGDITNLKIHPQYEIIVNGKLVCMVELDFEFYDNRKNKRRYLDVKGMDTPLSKLKRKLVEAAHKIEVELI